MRKYAILGSLLILGMALAGRLVSKASRDVTQHGVFQTPIMAIASEATKEHVATKTLDVVTLPNVPIVDEPLGLPVNLPKAEAPPSVQLTTVSLPETPPAELSTSLPPVVSQAPSIEPGPPLGEPPLVPKIPPAETSAIAPPSGEDPMGAVDSFLDRNRKEADRSIEALNQEAEALRSRLQKVEAALARWQDVSRALKSEGAAVPGQSTTTQLEPIPANPNPTPGGSKDVTASKAGMKWAKPDSEPVPAVKVEGGAFEPTPTTLPAPGTVLEPSPAVPTGPLPPPPAAVPGPVPEEIPTVPLPAPTPERVSQIPPATVPGPEPAPAPTPVKSPDALPSLPEPAAPAPPTSLPGEPKLPEVPKSAPTA